MCVVCNYCYMFDSKICIINSINMYMQSWRIFFIVMNHKCDSYIFNMCHKIIVVLYI